MKPFSLAVLILPVIALAQVETVRVTSGNVQRKVTLPGEFLPYQSVQVSARVNGYVEKVEVDRGSVVRKGQLLAVLSAPEMDAQLAEAESKVQSIDSQRVEAEARLISARSTHDRLKTASATPGAVAGNELVLAENAVAAAQALVRTQESAKRAAQAAVDAIRDLKNYLRVTAPFDGIITERYVHPGALAGPGANSAGPLLKLEQISRLRLVVAVPESDVGALRTGTHVTFTVPAFPGETFTGSIARIPRSMDPKTRTMAVELDVFNSKGRLAPGMYPEVSWPVNRGRSSLLVPPSSIVTTTERTFVIRVENGRAAWVNVRRASPAGDLVEVYGDLREGDQIVRRATDEIRNGSPVQVKPT